MKLNFHNNQLDKPATLGIDTIYLNDVSEVHLR